MTHPQARVLICDDNKVNRLLLGRNIELSGHRIAVAENGRIALEMLRKEPFDLLVLDIEMPEMDGFSVLQALKAEPSLADLPVIVTSSVEAIDSVVRCIELGAEDYLHKPVNPVLLKARLTSSLEKKRLRDQARENMHRFATSAVAADLQQSGFALGGKRVTATVMFTDVRGFTSMCERDSPEDVIDVLNTYYALTFEAISANGGVVNQIIGDGLMVLFGAPNRMENSAASAVSAAIEMHALVAQYGVERKANGKEPIQIGVGIATGDVIAGYTGTQQRATYTCVGNTVNLAARLEAHTKVAGKGILLDAATRRALPPDMAIEDLGAVQYKGKAQSVPTFAATIPE